MGILKGLKQSLALRKYADHADERQFDWKWDKINYNRIALVNALVARQPSATYLEIGCASNALFDSVPVSRKVGVDPAKGGNVRLTSDDFFKQNKERFDIVFIDGLHVYEQARRDVVNSLDCLNPNGWIALHDMLPKSWKHHHVPRLQGSWTGDVWKVAFELLQTQGIEFKIIKIDQGVGVIKVLTNDVKLPDLTVELGPKQFSYFYDNISKLPLIEWSEAYNWLMH